MEKMGNQNRQVISITHLPQIADQRHHNITRYIKKIPIQEPTAHIRRLTNEERVKEIANMLSGATLTDAALNNAKVLLGYK